MKSRLEIVFVTLNKHEIRELVKFVDSSFFNQRADVKLLLAHLIEVLPAEKPLDKSAIFKAIYPNKTQIDLQQIRLVMSKLLLLIEQYLSFKESSIDKDRINLYLASAYRKRGLEKHFNQSIRQLKKTRAATAHKNAEFFYEEFLLEQEQYRFSSKQKRIGEHNLQSIFNAMDISFIALKLRQACFSISHQAVYKKEYQIDLLEEIMHIVKQRDYISIPAIGVYYHTYLALTEGAPTHFAAFKKIIIEQPDIFPPEEIRDLYLLGINYCIKQLNNGEVNYANEAFALYKSGLELEALLDNGVLSRFSYRNIVAIGLLIQEFEWVEQFIHNYQMKLSPKHRKPTYAFNMARLAYSKKDYATALPLLQNIEYEDLLLNLAAKTILLKIYYELKEFSLLDAHLSSLQNFLRRKTLIGYHKQNYKNIISITRKLVAHNQFDKKEQEQLRQLILDTEILTERRWLLEQV